MPLTDTAIRNAKPKGEDYKLADGGGLFLLVTPTGSKLWRMRFKHLGKEQKLSFGTYPDVSLKDARENLEGGSGIASRTIARRSCWARCSTPSSSKRSMS